MIQSISPSRWPVFALFAIGGLSCGGDLLLPDPPGGGENVALSKVTGDRQVGTVGEQLLNPLVVQVLTERGLAAPGRRVEFAFASSVAEMTRDTAVTNDDGHAVIRWVLGTVAGSYTARARMADIEGGSHVAEFTAEAEAAAPDTVSGTSPLNQPGRRSQAVSTPPVIRVADRFGNPVGGVAVGWSVMSGEGVVSEPITETGEDGTTSVGWTLGGRVGLHRVTAAIGPVRGSPVTFTAVVLF